MAAPWEASYRTRSLKRDAARAARHCHRRFPDHAECRARFTTLANVVSSHQWVFGHRGAADHVIAHRHRNIVSSGTPYPARVWDAEYAQRKCVETIAPGHVLVQDCRGERGSASFGSILSLRLQVRGVAGMVSDGPVRDSATIAALDMPVFCAGASAPPNLIRHHAVDINVPIGCGGVAVFPDDVIVGDVDGVVVIPLKMADAVAQAAAGQEQLEAFLTERIRAGAALPGTYPPNDETKAAFDEWKKNRKI
ncbi:hypothetical protein [Paraburkholderia sp. Clong3]|uniref:RraA family protein n=1 Tax=Paraburkholderia sp. Clong3 TaxID=2991061 RepID=UPI003D1D74C2